MALIICPECGKNFSDRAPACPECGCPTSEIVGSSSSAMDGQLSIANNAFDDGRYEEAYSLFTQLYVKSQNNPQVLVRLGLSTAAKDYFNNGIPNSTIELIHAGLERSKSTASSYDAFTADITPFIADINKTIGDTMSVVLGGLSSSLKSLEYQRSAGQMISDALFMPAVSSHRNLYEDRRTIESNKKIIENALANKSTITRTLDVFGSEILKMTARLLTEPIKIDSVLYKELGKLVANKDDATIYESLTDSALPQGNTSGLCFGEETKIIDFAETAAFLYINGKPRMTGFKTPKGRVIITNYKVEYTAAPEKWSFQKPLDNLVKVKVGGPGNSPVFHVQIQLDFSDGETVYVSPKPAGSQATFVALLNEMLKMPNR